MPCTPAASRKRLQKISRRWEELSLLKIWPILSNIVASSAPVELVLTYNIQKCRPRWQTPVTAELSGGLTAYTLQAPSSGPLVVFMLNVLDGFIPAADDVVTHQRIAETMKYAYGMRTHMGDPQFVDIEEVIILSCLFYSSN